MPVCLEVLQMCGLTNGLEMFGELALFMDNVRYFVLLSQLHVSIWLCDVSAQDLPK